MGYQAGQHELLAQTYSTDCSRIIEDHLKTVKTQTKKIKKEAEEIENRMKQVYKQLDKKKVNYAEAHSELENLKIPTENDEKNLSRLELDNFLMRGGLNCLMTWMPCGRGIQTVFCLLQFLYLSARTAGARQICTKSSLIICKTLTGKKRLSRNLREQNSIRIKLLRDE